MAVEGEAGGDAAAAAATAATTATTATIATTATATTPTERENKRALTLLVDAMRELGDCNTSLTVMDKYPFAAAALNISQVLVVHLRLSYWQDAGNGVKKKSFPPCPALGAMARQKTPVTDRAVAIFCSIVQAETALAVGEEEETHAGLAVLDTIYQATLSAAHRRWRRAASSGAPMLRLSFNKSVLAAAVDDLAMLLFIASEAAARNGRRLGLDELRTAAEGRAFRVDVM